LIAPRKYENECSYSASQSEVGDLWHDDEHAVEWEHVAEASVRTYSRGPIDLHPGI